MRKRMHLKHSSGGFTLIELLAVLMIIGVLAAFGIPRYFKAVERNRLGEAASILQAVRDSTLRVCLKSGVLPAVAGLDVEMGTVKYFTVGSLAIGGTCAAPTASITRANVDCYAGCYSAACNTAVATLTDATGNITWTIVNAECQP